jgi:hypothetical protein
MERNAMQRLIDQAKSDPKFLHALVFNTESVLGQIDYLDRGSKAALVGASPEEKIARIFGMRPSSSASQDYAP